MRPPPLAGTLAAMNPQSPARVVAVTIVMTAALLAAGCSSSPSSTTSASPPSAGSTVAQAAPFPPGPDSSGQLQELGSGQQVGVSAAQLSTASNACQSLWPYQALTPAQQQRELTDDLKFAQCMRSHGVPTLPDPVATNGHVEFVIS